MRKSEKRTQKHYNENPEGYYFERTDIYRLDNLTSYEFWIVAIYLKKMLTDYVRRHDQIVLDVGSGTGAYTLFFKKLGFHTVIGSDFSSGMLKLSKSKGIPYLVQCDAELLPFRSRSVDIIASFALLEHVTRPNRVLLELCRLSSKEGKILLMTPNPLYYKLFRVRRLQESQFERFIPRDELEFHLYKKAKILDFSTGYILPPFIAIILKFIGTISRTLLSRCLLGYILLETRILQKTSLVNRMGYLQLILYQTM